MLYAPSTHIPSPTIRIITGRNLAHGRRSVLERAFLGADLHLDRTQLIEPTIKQCARLVGVCRPYVGAAVAIDALGGVGAAALAQVQAPASTPTSDAEWCRGGYPRGCSMTHTIFAANAAGKQLGTPVGQREKRQSAGEAAGGSSPDHPRG